MAEDKRDWISRVLGITLLEPQATAPVGQPGSGADPLVTWREAKDSVDERLNGLAAELREYEDPDLARIADLGLFALGGGEAVALMKGLMEFKVGGSAKAEPLRKAVAGYRAVLAASPLVKLVDNNPFGIAVGMAATLGSALDTIERALP